MMGEVCEPGYRNTNTYPSNDFMEVTGLLLHDGQIFLELFRQR
jgi:hypothetical protein